ncbi:MAG: PLD nuclease N-terminal domain-containing protein [Oscillospiraceae bacterium]|nr:PLD nuclease N-terminal domain-containing protein [Oscillospiraceae bacterium]
MDTLQLAIDLIMEWIWIILPLFILQLVLFIAALVSILRKDVTGTEKLPWILLSLFANTFGPIIYFIFGSGYLDRKSAERENRE